MIFIITVVTTLAFILGAIFVGFAPNARYIVEKDFLKKVVWDAQLEGLQYGDLCLRTHTIATPATHSIPDTKKIIGPLTKTDDKIHFCVKTTVKAVTGPNITVQVEKVSALANSNQCPAN